MNRKDFLRYTSLVAGGTLLFRNNVWASLLPRAGNLKLLRNSVGIYTERGGTIGFHAGKNGFTVIDTQFMDTAPNLIGELKKMAEEPFLQLLYTHHHGDHTGGGAAFKGLVQDVVAHKNAAAHHQSVSAAAKKPAEQLYATITFDEELKLKSEEAKLKGFYFGAGHTNGDAVYHFQDANIAHVGDLVFNRRHPFVDRAHGASMVHWAEALTRIVKKFDTDTLYVFGHSAEGYEVTGNSRDVLAFREYLVRVLEFARQEQKAGKNREEFVKNTTVPGVSEWKGDGLERSLGAAWDELTEAKGA
ncbi:MBL fold metallo-hydrolase [Flaviaesturariibacter aridisoli]|nr:MBL fold metallo-hydrolase [Flaviaesturariibacter aridisoli]